MSSTEDISSISSLKVFQIDKLIPSPASGPHFDKLEMYMHYMTTTKIGGCPLSLLLRALMDAGLRLSHWSNHLCLNTPVFCYIPSVQHDKSWTLVPRHDWTPCLATEILARKLYERCSILLINTLMEVQICTNPSWQICCYFTNACKWQLQIY